jgi:diguanylate cyclase (GGDEF)-like protein/PAS domain S-box-containing protein
MEAEVSAWDASTAATADLKRLRTLAGALEQIGEGVAVYDNDDVLIYGNRRFAQMHGVTVGQLEGRHMSDIVDLAAGTDISRQEFTWASPIGMCTVQVSVATLRDSSGAKTGTAVCILDVTVRKALEDQLRAAASHDPLTGLPNRRAFLDRLEEALAAAARDSSSIGVLFIDLDGFKAVNDTHGHDVGDQLLRQIGHRLKNCVRLNDTLARLAGDEFVALLVDLDGDRATEQANGTATRILSALSPPFLIGELALSVTASIGVALAQGGRAREVLHAADSAMYDAKLAGVGRIVTSTSGRSNRNGPPADPSFDFPAAG